MIYLFLEIPFAPQIERGKSEALDESLEALGACLNPLAESSAELNRKIRYWAFPHVKSKQIQDLSQALGELRSLLEDWEQTLTVYHISLLAAASLNEALGIFDGFRVRIPRQNQIWVDFSARDILAPYCQLEESPKAKPQ